MARLSMSLFGVVVTAVALVVPTRGAVAARTPPQDFVVGGGDAGIVQEISIDAHSDALGSNASGSVSFRLVLPAGDLLASGPVTCLAVDGPHAVISFDETVIGFGTLTLEAIDNGPVGSPPDRFGVDPLRPTDCSTSNPNLPLAPLDAGDIVVRDVSSKDQCRHGGWRNYTDATGQPFGKQGECIAFALGAA